MREYVDRTFISPVLHILWQVESHCDRKFSLPPSRGHTANTWKQLIKVGQERQKLTDRETSQPMTTPCMSSADMETGQS